MKILGLDINEDLILKFFKFGIVGVSGTAIDFGLTYFFKEILKTHKYIANGLGFIFAATSNYYFNRVWTFHSGNQDVFHEYLDFIGIALVGLGINTTILFIAQNKFNQKFWMAKVIATAITLIWNFLGSKFVFNG